MPLSRITSPFQSTTANVYSPSANTVAIRTASADRVTVDSNGNVGFGETSPAGSSGYTQLVVRGSSGAELSLKTGATQYGYVYVDTGGFRIINPQSGAASGTLQFHTSNQERMRIAATGGVSVNTTSSLATLTVNGNICPAEAPSSKWGLDFAPSTSAGSYISLANNATYDLITGSGLIWIWDDAAEGIGQIYCFYGSSTVTNVTGAMFTPTKDSASKINVYYESGTGKYRIQNKWGSTKNLWVSTIRMRAAS